MRDVATLLADCHSVGRDRRKAAQTRYQCWATRMHNYAGDPPVSVHVPLSDWLLSLQPD
jgi:hypothetical protein